jgi:hypothetical protein
MHVSPSKVSGMIRRLASFTLAIWLGGAACLFGCEISASAANNDERVASSNQAAPACSSASSSEHGCCHQTESEAEQSLEEPIPSSSSRMACCPLSAQPAITVSKTRVENAAALTLTPYRLLPKLDDRTYTACSTGRILIPDRGSTYLRCCVFLI